MQTSFIACYPPPAKASLRNISLSQYLNLCSSPPPPTHIHTQLAYVKWMTCYEVGFLPHLLVFPFLLVCLIDSNMEWIYLGVKLEKFNSKFVNLFEANQHT